MDKTTPITQAVRIVGLQPLAAICGVSYQAVRKWEKAGRLPRTEWTGETNYRSKIAAATDYKVTVDQLLQLGAERQFVLHAGVVFPDLVIVPQQIAKNDPTLPVIGRVVDQMQVELTRLPLGEELAPLEPELTVVLVPRVRKPLAHKGIQLISCFF